ncbi:hypothetical protein [Streptomyces dysideae]|nr:hypothetical protein [Streptomyces dysideae]
MVTSPAYGAPAGSPARHTRTVIAGCPALRLARIGLAPTEAEGGAA